MAYRVPAIENALALLKVLLEKQEAGVSLAQLAEATGLPRSSSHNILRTLEAHGIVRLDRASMQYNVGHALIELASHPNLQIGDPQLLHAMLVNLAREAQASAVLSRRVGDLVAYVDEAQGPQRYSVSLQYGGFGPLHSPALGSAILAFEPEEDIRAYVATATETTNGTPPIHDPATFMQKLEAIRQSGYAFSLEEWTEGINAVAAPVFDAKGRAPLSVGLVGLTSQLVAARIPEYADLAMNAAKEMTKVLRSIQPD